jgi:hypothetical protein
VKPGELMIIKGLEVNRKNRFIQPGHSFIKNGNVFQSLVYLEFLDLEFVLVRPVVAFKMPKQNSTIIGEKKEKDYTQTIVLRNIFYKNWHTIKSNKSTELLKPLLIFDIKAKLTGLKVKFEYIPIENFYTLGARVYETIEFEDNMLPSSDEDVRGNVEVLVKKNQYISSNTTVATVNAHFIYKGFVGSVKKNSVNNFDVLVFDKNDIKGLSYTPGKESPLVSTGAFIQPGMLLTKKPKITLFWPSF